MARVFIGIPVPKDIAAEIEAARVPLKRVRWLPPDSLHLTVEFMGDVGTERLRHLLDTLGRVHSPPIALEILAFGTLPARKPARVLCANLNSTSTLTGLVQETRTRLDAVGFNVSNRTLLPHVTVARLKYPSPQVIDEAIAALNRLVGLTFTARHLHVFESQLSPGGARYRSLASYPLET